MKRTKLNLAERRTIADLLHRKVNVTEIARRINRRHATVYREIKRNFFKDEESPFVLGNPLAGLIRTRRLEVTPSSSKIAFARRAIP